MPVQEDLLEKGFQLAYFIFPDRSVALCILSGALNKLRLQRGRESRRSYWRDKHLKRAITRITREESDALQWLIFYESDQYEKEQEQQTTPAIRDMIVRYVKNLVRMTTAMSSFYVNIGLQRLLPQHALSRIVGRCARSRLLARPLIVTLATLVVMPFVPRRVPIFKSPVV